MHSNLQEGVHYYRDKASGFVVFTEQYHLERGFCCNSGCRHCPFKNSCAIKPEDQAGEEEASKYSA